MLNREASHATGKLPVAPPSEHRTIRTTFRQLRMAGLSISEAGNLTAHLTGLAVTERSWTLQEIERLLFIRALVDQGRISP